MCKDHLSLLAKANLKFVFISEWAKATFLLITENGMRINEGF